MKKFIRAGDLEWVVTGAEVMVEGRQSLRDRLWDELNDMDPRSVDQFVRHIGKVNGFRIEEDSDEHRHLCRMLQIAWIKELDKAEDNYANRLDIEIQDQDEVNARWNAPLFSTNLSFPLTPTPSTPRETRTVRVKDDVRELYQTYIAERFPRLSAAARLERARTIAQFVEVVGLKEPIDYRKTDMSAFKAALIKLPPNAARDYPGISVPEIVVTLDDSVTRISTKTVQLRLSYMSSFGKWLGNNLDGIDAASFTTSAPVVKRSGSKVKEFTDEEVRKIFLSPTFTGCASERNQSVVGPYRVRDYRFWLPLLAAYTGCRLNELTQLRIDDIQQVNGIWAFKITASGPNQSLKTRASERLVPVHQQLLRAGFIERIEELKSKRHEILFPDIPLDRNGRRSEAASKRFRKFLARLGLKGNDTRGGIHRFRHTVVEELRQAGNSDQEIALVVGHETGTAKMTAGYGTSRQLLLSQRAAVLESLEYEGLDMLLYR